MFKYPSTTHSCLFVLSLADWMCRSKLSFVLQIKANALLHICSCSVLWRVHEWTWSPASVMRFQTKSASCLLKNTLFIRKCVLQFSLQSADALERKHWISLITSCFRWKTDEELLIKAVLICVRAEGWIQTKGRWDHLRHGWTNEPYVMLFCWGRCIVGMNVDRSSCTSAESACSYNNPASGAANSFQCIQ